MEMPTWLCHDGPCLQVLPTQCRLNSAAEPKMQIVIESCTSSATAQYQSMMSFSLTCVANRVLRGDEHGCSAGQETCFWGIAGRISSKTTVCPLCARTSQT